ncbi:hypothetical protein [Sponge holobiont-associated RNA virus]|nr:hypothetical protein [Sponge holobiont-associated RNA virus]
MSSFSDFLIILVPSSHYAQLNTLITEYFSVAMVEHGIRYMSYDARSQHNFSQSPEWRKIMGIVAEGKSPLAVTLVIGQTAWRTLLRRTTEKGIRVDKLQIGLAQRWVGFRAHQYVRTVQGTTGSDSIYEYHGVGDPATQHDFQSTLRAALRNINPVFVVHAPTFAKTGFGGMEMPANLFGTGKKYNRGQLDGLCLNGERILVCWSHEPQVGFKHHSGTSGPSKLEKFGIMYSKAIPEYYAKTREPLNVQLPAGLLSARVNLTQVVNVMRGKIVPMLASCNCPTCITLHNQFPLLNEYMSPSGTSPDTPETFMEGERKVPGWAMFVVAPCSRGKSGIAKPLEEAGVKVMEPWEAEENAESVGALYKLLRFEVAKQFKHRMPPWVAKAHAIWIDVVKGGEWASDEQLLHFYEQWLRLQDEISDSIRVSDRLKQEYFKTLKSFIPWYQELRKDMDKYPKLCFTGHNTSEHSIALNYGSHVEKVVWESELPYNSMLTCLRCNYRRMDYFYKGKEKKVDVRGLYHLEIGLDPPTWLKFNKVALPLMEDKNMLPLLYDEYRLDMFNMLVELTFVSLTNDYTLADPQTPRVSLSDIVHRSYAIPLTEQIAQKIEPQPVTKFFELEDKGPEIRHRAECQAMRTKQIQQHGELRDLPCICDKLNRPQPKASSMWDPKFKDYGSLQARGFGDKGKEYTPKDPEEGEVDHTPKAVPPPKKSSRQIRHEKVEKQNEVALQGLDEAARKKYIKKEAGKKKYAARIVPSKVYAATAKKIRARKGYTHWLMPQKWECRGAYSRRAADCGEIMKHYVGEHFDDPAWVTQVYYDTDPDGDHDYSIVPCYQPTFKTIVTFVAKGISINDALKAITSKDSSLWTPLLRREKEDYELDLKPETPLPRDLGDSAPASPLEGVENSKASRSEA